MPHPQNEITLNPEDIPSPVKALGTKLLSYVLDLPENEVKVLLETGGLITPEHVQVIEALKDFTNEIIEQRKDNQVIEDNDLMRMSFALTKDNHHIFNNIRKQIKNTTNGKRYSDPLMQVISKMCIECIPILLLPKKRSNLRFMLDIPFFTGRIFDDFCDALMSDPEVSEIFPKIEGYKNNSYRITTSTGRSNSLQIITFYKLLIQNSYTLMRMRNQIGITDFLNCAEENLSMIRKSIRGEKIKVPIILLFKGAWIPPKIKIKALNGTITSLHGGIEDIIYAEGLPPNFSDQKNAGFIYIAEVDYKISISKTMPLDPFDGWPDGLLYDSEKIEKIARNISFSCLMAIDRTEPISIDKISSFIFDPLAYGNSTSWRTNQNNICEAIEMTEEEGESIIKWCNTISEVSDAKILLAKRRLQSALTERINPIDGLIDCVIGLENLFGQRSEIVFSVAIAVSKLLEKDFSRRKKIFSDVKKIYGLRSSIIHGGEKTLNHDEMMEKRNQVAAYLIQCFKKLYSEHKELLQLSSTERSKELALL